MFILPDTYCKLGIFPDLGWSVPVAEELPTESSELVLHHKPLNSSLEDIILHLMSPISLRLEKQHCLKKQLYLK